MRRGVRRERTFELCVESPRWPSFCSLFDEPEIEITAVRDGRGASEK
jgi:hypothetical protein